jgi:hypothetical protein
VLDYVKIRRRNIHSTHSNGPEIVSTPISRAWWPREIAGERLSQRECHKRPDETYLQMVAGIRVARAEDRIFGLGSRRWSSRGPGGGRCSAADVEAQPRPARPGVRMRDAVGDDDSQLPLQEHMPSVESNVKHITPLAALIVFSSTSSS